MKKIKLMVQSEDVKVALVVGGFILTLSFLIIFFA